MKSLFRIFFLLIFSGAAVFAQETVVTGSFTRGEYDSIAFNNAISGRSIEAKALKTDGSFRFTPELQKGGIFNLQFRKNDAYFLVLQPGDQVHVKLNPANLKESAITGSEATKHYYETEAAMAGLNAKRDSIIQVYSQKKVAHARDFVQANHNSLAALFYMDAIKSQHPRTFIRAANALYGKYPDNPLVQQYKKTAGGLLNVQKGKKAPEIALPNPQGDTVRLSSLEGNVVLVDFWASWCGPCRKESPNLVKAYSKYKDEGFEIYSVSLDRSRKNWVKAIEDDHLDWTHVSDLKYWNSLVVDLYGFSGIPHTVLLDEQGRVIAKNLRGEALGEKLEEVLD